MAKKSKGTCKWLYLVFPIAIACLLVFMALTAFAIDGGFLGTATYSFYNIFFKDSLLFGYAYTAVGVSTLVINIILALYFLVVPFVSEKTNKKLGFLTLLALVASAIANLVLSIYVCAKIGWDNIAFFGVVTYILWFAIAGLSLVFAVVKAYKAFKK